MIYGDRKIKDIYGISFDKKEIKNHMEEWYYKLIQKTYKELDMFDVSRMVIQKVFLPMAADKAIDFILQDPICGFKWDGEVLELLYQLSSSNYESRIEEVKQILVDIKKNIYTYDWGTKEDCMEYGEILDVFMKKIFKK